MKGIENRYLESVEDSLGIQANDEEVARGAESRWYVLHDGVGGSHVALLGLLVTL